MTEDLIGADAPGVGVDAEGIGGNVGERSKFFHDLVGLGELKFG